MNSEETFDSEKSRFAVGDKIVCVNAEWKRWHREVFSTLPKQDNVYVIRSLDESVDHRTEDEQEDRLVSPVPGVYLVGIFGEESANGTEFSFTPRRFVSLEAIRRASSRTQRERAGLQLDFSGLEPRTKSRPHRPRERQSSRLQGKTRKTGKARLPWLHPDNDKRQIDKKSAEKKGGL